MQSTDLRPLHEIATDIVRDPAFRGRARMSARPHLEVLLEAETVYDIVGWRKVSLTLRHTLDCLRTYKNKQLKSELLDHLQSHCRVIQGGSND